MVVVVVWLWYWHFLVDRACAGDCRFWHSMLLCSKRTVDCADSFKLLRNWPVSNWHLAKAATTRAVNVSPILS
eukprot:COSAG02_NODE_20354_length_835_cov_1.645380_1_plen_72_part_10